ncbi:hypothetical protein [Caldimonas tepidiphila]|uniref:hypothetical protein n=1 Tax=Caldimonas tepidiphila TaxID=2315841 RepID=UPI000E5C216C|nr:hypothetical protein [Caldimonas tepidiphila]
MDGAVEFSGPVPVAEGMAFCVSVPGRRKSVAVVTRDCLGVDEGTDATLMRAAFHRVEEAVHAAAASLARQGAPTPIFIERQHLQAVQAHAEDELPARCS